MKKTLLLSLVLMLSIAGYGQMGIGVRLGDPSGITFKKYNGDNALELSIGRFSQRNSGFFNKRFDLWFDDQQFGYSDVNFQSFKSSAPFGLQVHYLMHKDWFASELAGLQWYCGFGGQFRVQTFTFSYRYKIAGSSNWINAGNEKITDLDLGADGVLGAEYEFEDVPIRVFTDVTLFMEVVDNPFLFWFQYGIGGRYMF